ncbi:hypothetical protein [Marinomonas pollencensis]|nr:hypothetical protein [Marinomonas pollencensis]
MLMDKKGNVLTNSIALRVSERFVGLCPLRGHRGKWVAAGGLCVMTSASA